MNVEKAIFQVELAQRTLVNYWFIRQAKERRGNVYEVTQLVTGMVSFFVWIKEKHTTGHPYNKSLVVTWGEFEKIVKQRPFPSDIHQNLQQLTSYLDLIYYLRNAFAHGNLSFEEKGGEIIAITLWNEKDKNKNWSCTMPIEGLESLAKDMVYDLNEAACQKYMKNVPSVMPVNECSKCFFKWLGTYRPPKCPLCNSTVEWETVGYLHFI